MPQPAAKKGDQVFAVDTHIVVMPLPAPPTPLPNPFNGILNGNLSTNVNIQGQPAATVDSTAENIPQHIYTPPGIGFQKKPTDSGTVINGSTTVFINGKGVARAGDTVRTCNDPTDLPVGTIIAVSTVLVGG
jgi:uncharacterized Zn-binding protein involved in type VI secretion